MKTSKPKHALLLLLAIAFSTNVALSQCKEYKWPEDRSKAEEQLALYGDAMKQGNYRAAVPGIRWFLTNAPDWNVKLYIDATDVYNKLATAEKDPTRKKQLVDSLMWLYDERIKVCNDEVNVLNRKAIYAAYHMGGKKETTGEVLNLLDKVLDMSGEEVLDNNLDSYFKIVQANHILLKNLSEDQILAKYDKLMNILDKKITAAQQKGKTDDVEKYQKIKSTADGILVTMVDVNCDFVKKNMEPKFRENPKDITLAKKIFAFMLQGKCTDDPLWLEAGEAIFEVEKDFGLAKNLGLKHLALGNEQKAQELLGQAQELATSPENKSEVLISLGAIEAKNGNKSAARNMFLQAAKADPSNKEAYEKIGDLYMTSFNECGKKKSLAEDRLVYLAAYDMYARAGNGQKMAQARAQFPSVPEIFELNWKEGETKTVECWINETVTLKTRGKD